MARLGGKALVLVLFLTFSACVVIPHASAVASSVLYVTFVNAQRSNVQPGDPVTVVFDVIYFTSEPYVGNISVPAVGLKTATLLLTSNQVREFPNVPLSPGAQDGEYQAKIQIPQDLSTGSHTLYVKAQSLQLTVNGTIMIGPLSDVSSGETETTSDYSMLQVQPTPSPLSRLLSSTQDLLLLTLAIIILVLLALPVLAHYRRRFSTSKGQAPSA
jgi:hypothetical protein